MSCRRQNFTLFVIPLSESKFSFSSGVSSSETSGRKAQSLQIPTKSDSEMLMGRIVLRRGKSMNDLNCQLRAEDEQTTLLKNKFPENEDLLLSLQFAHQVFFSPKFALFFSLTLLTFRANQKE